MVADRMVSLVLLVTVGSIGIVSGQSTTVECRTEYITLWDTIYKKSSLRDNPKAHMQRKERYIMPD